MRERHEDARLSAFLDDELGDDDALEVTRHLVACQGCLDELETLRTTRRAIRGLPPVDPPETLLAGIADAAVVQRAQARFFAVAVAGLGLGLAAYFFGVNGGSPTLIPNEADTVETPSHDPVLTTVDFEP